MGDFTKHPFESFDCCSYQATFKFTDEVMVKGYSVSDMTDDFLDMWQTDSLNQWLPLFSVKCDRPEEKGAGSGLIVAMVIVGLCAVVLIAVGVFIGARKIAALEAKLEAATGK